MKRELQKIGFVNSLMQTFLSEWVNALLLLAVGPLFVVYCGFSFLKQQVRSACCQKRLKKDDPYAQITFVALFVLLVTCGAFMFIFGVFFSDMGRGVFVYNFLSQHYEKFFYFFAAGSFVLLNLYIFWDLGGLGLVNGFFFSLGVVCFLCGGLLMTPKFPQIPWLIFIVGLPAWLGVTKAYMFPQNRISDSRFFKAMAWSLTISSVLCLVSWIVWVILSDKMWSDELNEKYVKMGLTCIGDTVNTTTNVVENSNCVDPAYMIWILPMALACTGLFFALVLGYLSTYHGTLALSEMELMEDMVSPDSSDLGSSDLSLEHQDSRQGELEGINKPAGWVTRDAESVIAMVKKWSWAHVLIKVVYIGIIYFVFQVGVGIAVNIFLSWLNDQLVKTSLVNTTFIFVGVGVVMFLMPPVPGVPVYLAGGIILVTKAQTEWEYMGKSQAYWLAIAFTIGVCFFLKLLAVVMEQVCIGYLMSNNLTVKTLVGINSSNIQAIKRILSRPGFSVGKIAILCGGPDWPTSVLTGILRLNVLSMVLGSLPVVFLVSPCVFAAAFMIAPAEIMGSSLKASLESLALLFAFFAQTGALVAAGYYTKKEVEAGAEEFKAYVPDMDVKKADVMASVKTKLYREKTTCYALPLVFRVILSAAALLMVLSCYTWFFFAEKCFVSFNIKDSTIKDTLNGSVLNVVQQPFGLFPLASFALSFCCGTASVNLYGKYKVCTDKAALVRLESEAQIDIPVRASAEGDVLGGVVGALVTDVGSH
eukprot:CAMPEP_0175124234 /NCGR_PEP_ID=MMETSP0087-20121206/2670_1 /TAXON_ID=136419 /ORGANISM="Unknown Unknown, Strain D1" /LENGTH=759 /DNA_ID=CAMNT_0016405983 /DNA_START=240 /DNA_END=2520 /DNA_ORIENTATION=-